MREMFHGFRVLMEVDFSGLNTFNVTDTINMFGGCSSLTGIDTSRFEIKEHTGIDRVVN